LYAKILLFCICGLDWLCSVRNGAGLAARYRKAGGWLSDRLFPSEPLGLHGSVIAVSHFIGPGWLPERKVRICKKGSKKMTHLSMKTAGIDTGKDELHVCLLPAKEAFKVDNTAEGITILVRRCRAAGIVRAAIESTSIYHRDAVRALQKAGIEAAVIQPRQARAFAMVMLQWAKSDPIDSFVLARLGQVLDELKPVQDEKIEKLAEFLLYVEQTEERIAWLKTSLERYRTGRLRSAIEADIKALEKRRKAELSKLEADIRKDQAMAKRLDLLLSIPCVGERTAIGLLIRMPELGSLSREQAARLAGLAPCLNDTAKRTGERHIQGGRAKVRKTIFMAAFTGAMQWNQDLMTFYRRLIAKGKAHTEAIIACSRKLLILANTILARQSPWQNREVTQ
jgi:transposase